MDHFQQRSVKKTQLGFASFTRSLHRTSARATKGHQGPATGDRNGEEIWGHPGYCPQWSNPQSFSLPFLERLGHWWHLMASGSNRSDQKIPKICLQISWEKPTEMIVAQCCITCAKSCAKPLVFSWKENSYVHVKIYFIDLYWFMFIFVGRTANLHTHNEPSSAAPPSSHKPWLRHWQMVSSSWCYPGINNLPIDRRDTNFNMTIYHSLTHSLAHSLSLSLSPSPSLCIIFINIYRYLSAFLGVTPPIVDP